MYHKDLIKKLTETNRFLKKIYQLIFDVFLLIIIFQLTFYIIQEKFYFENYRILLVNISIIVSVNYFLGFYDGVIRVLGNYLFLKIISLSGISTLVLYLVNTFYDYSYTTLINFYLCFFINSLSLFGLSRILIRVIFLFNFKGKNKDKIIIYGANETGKLISNLLLYGNIYIPIAFIDNDKNLIGSKINSIKIYKFEDIRYVIKKYKVNIIAIPQTFPERHLSDIIKKLKDYNLQIKLIPNIDQIANGSSNNIKLEDISIERLIGRKRIKPIKNLISKNIENKVVFITGGGGSIGSEVAKIALYNKPKKLIIADISEYSLYRVEKILSKKFSKITIKYYLGDISSRNFLEYIFNLENKIDTVYHCAAYKHVNIIENNIIEGFRNNFFSTFNLIYKLSEYFKNINFTLVSTDKAVKPSNIMGVSKRLSEILCQEFQSKNPNLNISIVRFGNVLMSSGSVIPLFQEQIQSNQPITITDKRMKRYFMDLNEAAELILQASSISSNDSEVFVLDMGEPISIIEIANQLIKINGKSPSINHNKGIKIKIIGAKKGEKIFEELFVDKNKKITIHPKIFKARERLKKQVITKIFIKRISNLIENRDEIGLIKFFKKLDIGFKIND